MDNKSRQLSLTEMKIYYCCDNIFETYTPSPIVNTNDFRKETPQSVSSWLHYINRNKLTSITKYNRCKKKKIYVHLIGPFPDILYEADGTFCKKISRILKSFIEIYFCGMSVIIFDKICDHREIKCKTRIHLRSGQTQLFLPDINLFLNQNRPKDAFCVCGFSWFDLYPTEDLNHILGEGSFHNGTVAFSFGHYSKFKEKEARQKAWQSDFVVEPSIEINDSLNKRDLQEERLNNSFVYITQIEKEEAQKNISEYEHNCLLSPKSSRCSPKSSSHTLVNRKLNQVSIKLQSLVRKDSSISSPFASPCENSNQDLQYSHEDESVLNIMSEIQTQVRENADFHPCCMKTPTEEDWDTCEDADDLYRNISNGENAECDRLVKSALPPGSEFKLNCITIRRILRVLSHEICHVMGMMHCQYYKCTLNASSSILEVDWQPLFLCPVCVRKLQLFLKIDVLDRYKALDSFLTQYYELECTCGQQQLQKSSCSSFNNDCKIKDDLRFVRRLIDFVT